jgi:hypothetical protein
MGKLFLVLLWSFVATHADARVFKLKEQTVGTYIQGTGGTSVLSNSAYSRTDATFENKVEYTTSAEFGLMFLASRTWIRLGIELIRPQAILGAQAKDSSDVVLYRVDSNVLAWGPVVNFEFPLSVGESSRFFVSGGLGYMKITVKNDYHMTSAGNTLYGVADYAEEASGYSFMGSAGLGFEMGLADTATFVLSSGYRGLIGSNLKHERANSGIGGAINSGDTLRDNNGDRIIDMSGFWAGAAFRFYWNW